MALKAGERVYMLEDVEAVARQLRCNRRALGLTTRALGAMVDLTQSQYSRVEGARQIYFSAPVRQKVALAAGVLGLELSFIEADWRTEKRTPRVRKAASPVFPVQPGASRWDALEWAIGQGWLTVEQALIIAVRMSGAQA